MPRPPVVGHNLGEFLSSPSYDLGDFLSRPRPALQSSPKTIDTPDGLLSIWCHECLRVFSDRLVEKKDTDWFYELLVNQARSRRFLVEALL